MVSNGQLFKNRTFLQLRGRNRAPGAGMWVFSGITKRITLLKQRNSRRDRAPCAETGCFGDLQNELRCKNNGIGEETARRARECGCFRESQNELRCKNNGIGGETAHLARKLGVFGIYKTNYVVKTTELGRKPRGGRGNGVFSGIAKRITL